ncbi:MAG: thioredoxin domain-containing protein, partial [Chloroflexi bacterium]|nr:thioredoxin domain-containing protein [Chloroflexota bacterium]
MPNKLANSSSPYLLQHADNPVDWFPWGEEALKRSLQEDKPIFLSIGYAACHWCHVMAHESFEDPDTAEIMNNFFINIKVDREERPDIDNIYMAAVVALIGQGGWPLSVFLTPDQEPFYGGTYFPPVSRYNMPAFRDVLLGVAKTWKEEKSRLLDSGTQISEYIKENQAVPGQSTRLSSEHLDRAADT